MTRTRHAVIAFAALLAVTGCHSRRKKAEPVQTEAAAKNAAIPRAEYAWRLQCKEYDPYKAYESSGRAKPPEKLPEGLNGRLLAQKNAEGDAAGKLLKEVAKKCNVPDEVVARIRPYDIMIQNSRIVGEAPDGTVNVTVQILGKDILDVLGAVSQR